MSEDTENRNTDMLVDETYIQMKRLAASYLQNEAHTVCLSPTVLVHEAYVKLSNQHTNQFQNKSHFLAIAATIMRRILVDHARTRHRLKRGGDRTKMYLTEDVTISVQKDTDILAVEELLKELYELDERQARIVEMRFFAGMTVPEVAESLGLSTRTVENEWKMCRAWLRSRLEDAPTL